MKVLTGAVAGTLESSDAFVSVEPADTLEIELQSVVSRQYGEAIRAAVVQVLEDLDVQSGRISVNDRGALDCVIRARVETALRRAGGEV